VIRDLLAAYLVLWLTVASVVLGALPILMIHRLSGGRWGLAIERPMGDAARLVPWIGLAFLPVALGCASLYSWVADPGPRGLYLNVPFFLGRSLFYFIAWTALARSLLRPIGPTARRNAALGLIAHLVLTTFASVDWIMSLTPDWHSTAFGLAFLTSQLMGALAYAIARVRTGDVDPQTSNDLGNLLLAFVMLWTYIQYTQYMIIWIGDLPEDVTWYVPRSQTDWQVVSVLLFIVRFAVPFVLLLSRSLKRDARRLAVLARALLVTQVVENIWLVEPTFRPEGFRPMVADLLLVTGACALAWLSLSRPKAIEVGRA
jgi:hypothetical protein